MQRDEFKPESVEEQIEQQISSQETASLEGQLIQGLHNYHTEDRRSFERMWQRLLPHIASHEISTRPARPVVANGASRERIPVMKSDIHPTSRRGISRFGLIAAVACTILLVSTMVVTFQILRSNRTVTPPLSNGTATSTPAVEHGIYLVTDNTVEKLDLQTRTRIWKTSLPTGSLPFGTLKIIGDTAYLSQASAFYALDTKDGHIRWSRSSGWLMFPYIDGGLLYLQEWSSGQIVGGPTPKASGGQTKTQPSLYAVNPVDGTVRATYNLPDNSRTMPTVINGILYYVASETGKLTALRLSDRSQLWQQPIPNKMQIESLKVSNGMVYLALMKLGEGASGSPSPGTPSQGFVMAFSTDKGEKRWTSDPMPGSIREFVVTETAVYVASVGDLDAFDAKSGKHLWHQQRDTLQLIAEKDVLYLSDMTPSPAKGLAALKTSDGTELWHTALSNSQEAGSPLARFGNTVYTVSNDGTGKNRAIEAFNISGGTQLWRQPLEGDVLMCNVFVG